MRDSMIGPICSAILSYVLVVNLSQGSDTFRLLQSFHSRAGKAYLFLSAVNVITAAKEQRLMTTGLHTVCDLFCNGCMQPIGWKYVGHIQQKGLKCDDI